ncbi:MAG: hypothetical protein DA328_01350 [Nitrososphaeraceae archaeon]|nr:hypothetical protein [Nitrososphaeraceae archaeon]
MFVKSMVFDINYDRIKHLVEVEEDILAVFTIDSSWKSDNLTIAKDVTAIDSHFINNITNILKNNFNIQKNIYDDIIGYLKWKILEFSEIRIMMIYENDRTIIVLIKKDTDLGKTADTIIGYYYDNEETPKSLF